MTEREKLLAKIRALTAKTVAAGCTEAEAMAAAEKVAALMREHAIPDDLVEMENASMGVRFNARHMKAKLCSAIGVSTNCAIVHSRNGRSRENTVIYVGPAAGPQVACYLHDVLHRAVDAAVKAFRKGDFYRARRSDKTRRKAVDDFTFSMVDGLCRRLVNLFRETISSERYNAASRACEALFPDAITVKRRENKARFAAAQFAGLVAADQVNIHRGVERGVVSGLIGKAGA